MSATEESTRRDGSAVVGDEIQTTQLNDTLLVEGLLRASQDASSAREGPAKDAAMHTATDGAKPPSSDEPSAASAASAAPTANAASTESTANNAPAESAEPTKPSQAEETLAATLSKGKDREDAPTTAHAFQEHELSNEPSTEDGPESIMAIGPAQDEIKAAPTGPGSGPICNITLLLTSGGRHPYRIDSKYLGRRNVAIPDVDDDGNPDPFSISIYTLKELILREWRVDWEAKPASPSSIRLIYFGKLLNDKEQLKSYQFSSENPNVVHMSIRPQDLDDEEPKSGSKSLPSGHGHGERAREGRCCVIL